MVCAAVITYFCIYFIIDAGKFFWYAFQPRLSAIINSFTLSAAAA